MIYAAFLIASVASQAISPSECGLIGVSQSLNNLRMEVCLKESRPGKGFSSYQVSFINITDRPIYLFVEDSLLHRFSVQIYINKELINRRQTDGDDHFPSDIFEDFNPVLIPTGKSVSYETDFSVFKAHLRSFDFSKTSSAFFSFWPPDYYSFDPDTGKPNVAPGIYGKTEGVQQEEAEKKPSPIITFHQIRIDWDAPETAAKPDTPVLRLPAK